jgi:hypothetical protein
VNAEGAIMKTTKAFLVLAVTLSCAMACGLARAGGSVHFGVVVGVPGPWYYPAPYYPPYYPAYAYPPVVVQQPAPAYVEQAAPAAQKNSAATGVWYYCSDAKAYYPYVKDCPGGWQKVAAGPPPQQPAR